MAELAGVDLAYAPPFSPVWDLVLAAAGKVASKLQGKLPTKSLQDPGFTKATSVDMRFDDWVKAGYPVAKPK